MLNLTDFYNHEKFLQGAKEGEKVIKNTPINTKPQQFKVGDHVISSDLSPIIITLDDNAIIVDYYKTCYGYYVYEVDRIKPGCKRKRIVETFNEKNLARA